MAGNKPRVGILALQGDFEAHQNALNHAGAETVQVRSPADLKGLDGLVLPGGESTTMLRLLRDTGLFEPLREFAGHHPMFGTCAGAILMAKHVENPVQESLDLFDIAVQRNGYGRQLDSRITQIQPEGSFEGGEMEAVFIRAPIIRQTGEGVEVLARYQDAPVLVRQGKHLIATFHPELTSDLRIHKLFLDSVGSNGK